MFEVRSVEVAEDKRHLTSVQDSDGAIHREEPPIAIRRRYCEVSSDPRTEIASLYCMR